MRQNNVNRLGRMPFSDPLARRQWIKEGLVSRGKTSFFRKFQSRSFDGIIYHMNSGLQTNNKGNEIIYDFDGFLTQVPLEGDAQLSGTGTDNKKFSASFYTRNFHNTANIPKEWDLQTIGSMELRRTSRIRKQLSDLYTAVVNQAKFDVVQGFGEENEPTHIIMPNGKTDRNNLTEADKPSLDLLDHIIYAGTTGEDINVGGERPGLKQWTDSDETGEYDATITMFVDFYFLDALSKDPGWRSLYGTVLTENLNNPLIAKLGNVVVHKNLKMIRAPFFQGYTIARDINKSAVESAGFRRYDAENGKWTGEKGFNLESNKMTGRASIVGAGAMNSHATLCPVDPFTIERTNHNQKGEAGIHYYMNVKRTQLFEHNGDYAMRKMTGYDLGIINVDYHL